MQYITDYSQQPPICLPLYINTLHLEDVTGLTDAWRVFIDVRSGQVHDGSKYAADMFLQGVSAVELECGPN